MAIITKTFNYEGGVRIAEVPAGTTTLTIHLWGGAGGGGGEDNAGAGGGGSAGHYVTKTDLDMTSYAGVKNISVTVGGGGQGNNGTLYSSSQSRMYSISAVDCGLSTFVHELGHNMGLGHSVRQGSVGGVYNDGIGHGVDNNFSTIMAYPQAFGSATQLDYFSDPYW